MKTKKNSYGSICIKETNGAKYYQVQFHNPLLNEVEIKKSFQNEDDAILYLQELNYSFFEKNSNLLPRGISINRRNKAFSFCVNVKGKIIKISSSKDLDEICNDKFDFIKSFLS